MTPDEIDWARFWVESALGLRAYADATERAAAVTDILVAAVKGAGETWPS